MTKKNDDDTTHGPASKEPPSVKEKWNQFKATHSVWDLFNPSKPWVLVENGSLLGIFDFVPQKFRTGPWSHAAYLCFALLAYLSIYATRWMVDHQPPNGGWTQQFLLLSSPYQAYTPSWYYNLAGFIWMTGMSWNIKYRSPAKGAAWATYTVQSWTMANIRHGLCVLAPFVPSVTFWAEVLRFPVLITASATFAVWNFVLFPALMLFFLKDPEQKKRTFKYLTNFRLTQLHVFNIVFAVANGVMAQPIRPLHLGDLYIATVLAVIYMIWYYAILDRFGIHLYPIFSPRTPLVIVSWTLIIAVYAVGYVCWKGYLSV